MTRSLSVFALASALAAAACGSSPSLSPAGGSLPPPVLGQPISGITPGQWNWVPFPDSACGDGSPTGIGVNPGTGPDLVLFLDGGGACATGLTCFTFRTATTLGPFGPAEFAKSSERLPGSILDRALRGNPFADATLVFVPYCTGDVHGGDKVVNYTDVPGTVHHVGHSNVLSYLERIAATYTAPRRLVVSGSSAGGFGSIVNYGSVRAYYPAAQGFLIDDSGPPLESDPGPLISEGLRVWGIADVLAPLCGGPGICEVNLSRGLAALARNHPADRFSLLSWNVDPVISAFYARPTPAFTASLLAMTADVIDPAPNIRAFIVAGQSHTVLGSPGAVSQNGVSLVDWLAQQVSGSAAWSSVKPP
jgi:pectinacetylesterase